MTVGFVMLAHTALERAADVARHLAEHGCPVAVHVDRRTPNAAFDDLAASVADLEAVSLTPRLKCDWGTWSLIEASRSAAARLLAKYPDLSHVMLISGACLPIKPVAELQAFLRERPETDFIESVTIADVPWAAGGLSEERFTMSFPFAWKRQRWLFDLWVDLQRRVGRKRSIPKDLQPHLGSQWWCLSRGTIERILTDPARAELDRYFRRVWIPDESYFQTLVRHYGTRVESRSLTLSKFDYLGKPHVFYDDHLGMLLDSPAFFARKVWPGAVRLYETFLNGAPVAGALAGGRPGAFLNRVFGEAVSQRTEGRAGLAMAGRFPREGFENGVTAAPYAVFHGFGDVFEEFPAWVARETGSRAHGALFGPGRAAFADGAKMWAGALSGSAALRDYDPEAFLRNLIWNTRGEHQSFLLSARDNLKIGPMLARDRNATVFVVTGAWILPLMRKGRSLTDIRLDAARFQTLEAAFMTRLRERRSLATTRIWSLADVLERPSEPLQEILDSLTGAESRTLSDLPAFRSLDGLSELLQELKDAGMNPYMAGEVTNLAMPLSAKESDNVIRLR